MAFSSFNKIGDTLLDDFDGSEMNKRIPREVCRKFMSFKRDWRLGL